MLPVQAAKMTVYVKPNRNSTFAGVTSLTTTEASSVLFHVSQCECNNSRWLVGWLVGWAAAWIGWWVGGWVGSLVGRLAGWLN